ncbi:DUF4236 domain-containing protein [Lamprobacter modestohalophilus]|uniref:DUF4236 domain-containing protein n=1 Tax=Lamprobacter modestohalophilus TaxID=1064514 RepID=UPI002ADED524|nr:DUF4236 domain-containing protein [Lamprobacter modestohalophilus]MEA1051260.1 DUF4236 domain-containing protein [Lamprobacter modestohalophilus]
MSFRFWRRVQLFPGVSLNLSKSGASLSLGPRGAKYTIGARGTCATVGLPGTGLFYTVQNLGRARQDRPRSTAPVTPTIPVQDRLSLGFFQRLVTSVDEQAFVAGLRALHSGDEAEALAQLESAPEQADAAWTAGLLRLKRHELEAAHALQRQATLGQLYAKYQVNATTSFSVTPGVTAHIGPRERGTRLALAEPHQLRDEHALAAEHLRLILAETPEDVVVKAALAELLLDVEPIPLANADQVVQLSAGLENETPVHAALLLYKARALRALGLHEVAVSTLTQAYRRKKDRPEDLLRQIRYERALAYADVGRRGDSGRELSAIYAEDPGFEDVAVRLGVRG